MKQHDWDGADASAGRVSAGFGAELLLHTKVNLDQVFQPGVVVPHVSKDLRHISEITFYSTLVGGQAACCQDSHRDMLLKYL